MRQVSGRAAWGVVVGLLLPVPLVLVGGIIVYGAKQPSAVEDSRVSPVLSFEERMERVTYHRSCAKASDCEPPLGCLGDARFREHYCTDSECTTDAQCQEGSICRALRTRPGGPQVRFCVPVGMRQEGERCSALPSERAQACGPGLVCGGGGWCGRPCREGDSTSCPQGFFCADLPPESTCLPTCETRGCPDGQQCIQSKRDGASACAVVHGTNCQQAACPEGEQCLERFSALRPAEHWMQCVRYCDPKHPVCPEGSVCYERKCHRPCDARQPGACGEGYRCMRSTPDAPFVCQPDYVD